MRWCLSLLGQTAQLELERGSVGWWRAVAGYGKAQKDVPMIPSPGFEIYSPHTIAAIAAQLGEQGIDPPAALQGTDSLRRSSQRIRTFHPGEVRKLARVR
jgi:hypothetical protein